ALFVGFNHHHQGVIFGAALLYDETIPSFVWLFKEFLRRMGGVAPETIFTDQDSAMAAAVKEVLPKTFHGLCTFHVLQNARRNLSTLFTQDFVRKFLVLCYDVDNEQEFDDVWDVMIRECFPSYGPTGHKWCKYIRRFREQWSSAWVRNHYTAGMVSTQLVESTNSVLRGFLQPNHSLVEFFPHFDRYDTQPLLIRYLVCIRSILTCNLNAGCCEAEERQNRMRNISPGTQGHGSPSTTATSCRGPL
ncbi:Protein FAR-RED IMPAIRED RESPONSE 1, partial [Linum perenne]